MARNRWKDTYYVRAYELARSGLSNQRVAKALGIAPPTFANWVRERPAFKDALDRARAALGMVNQKTFRTYIYDHLPDNLKMLWADINKFENTRNSVGKVEALLEQAGKRARQHLFLYALVHHNFNCSAACLSVNIARSTLELWISDEPEFAELMHEIDLHKKSFYEEALVDLVHDREPSAVIFANRTYNRDKYGDKLDVNMNGEIKHQHNHLHFHVKADDVAKYMTLEDRKKVLEAIRKAKAAIRPDHNGKDVLQITANGQTIGGSKNGD